MPEDGVAKIHEHEKPLQPDREPVVARFAKVERQRSREHREPEEASDAPCGCRAPGAEAHSERAGQRRKPCHAGEHERQPESGRARVEIIHSLRRPDAEGGEVILAPDGSDVSVGAFLATYGEWRIEIVDEVAPVRDLRIAEAEDSLRVRHRLRLIVPQQGIGEMSQERSGE